MRKICIFLGFFIAASTLHSQAIEGGTMYVAIKTIELASSTGFFASVQGKLVYGDAVKILQIKGKWVQVRSSVNSSVSGWTAVTNLSAKRIVSGSPSVVTASEVGLSGKGFNQEIENAYKAKGNLNYADVDRIDALQTPRQYLYDFIVRGRLFQGGE